jgi:DNA-binding MarR family transcriptional regulator
LCPETQPTPLDEALFSPRPWPTVSAAGRSGFAAGTFPVASSVNGLCRLGQARETKLAFNGLSNPYGEPTHPWPVPAVGYLALGNGLYTGTMQRETQLERSPLHLLHRVHQRATELFQEKMAGIDITARQYVVLVTVAQNDGASQQDIIDNTGIDRSTVSQIMQTMIRKGLLKRKRTKEDARAYAIAVTDQGRDILKASEAIVEGVNEALVAALSATRAKTFIDNLRSIIAERARTGA